VIEDSIYSVRAVKQAKMKCIAILSNTYSKEELQKEKSDLIIKSISEKQQIMQFILNSDSENRNQRKDEQHKRDGIKYTKCIVDNSFLVLQRRSQSRHRQLTPLWFYTRIVA
jgi:hypothetical protein